MVAHREGQRISGAWGTHTSTIDWCEDNYVHTDYIAETYNTLSNIPFILLGLYAFVQTLSALRTNPFKWRYAIPHLGIAIIGMGSFAFHASLKWHAQVLLDELPMIWVTSWVLWLVWSCRSGEGRREEDGSMGGRVWAERVGLKVGVAVIPMFITTAYLTSTDPIMHQVAFATIMFLLYFRLLYLLRTLPLTSKVRHESYALMINGLFIFVAGFAIWNIDNLFCECLTGYRKMVGEGMGWVSQGHAWWHLLTGLGSSRMVIGINYLLLSIEEQDAFELVYAYHVFPRVQRRVRSLESKEGTPPAMHDEFEKEGSGAKKEEEEELKN